MVLFCILASKVAVALLPCQYLVFSGFKILAIVIDVSIVTFVSFCIFSMTNDVKHFFHVLIYHLYIVFGEMCVQIFHLFKNFNCFENFLIILCTHTY